MLLVSASEASLLLIAGLIGLPGPVLAQSISINTDGTTPWTVNVPSAGVTNATPYLVFYSQGGFTKALSVTSNGNSAGTLVGGGPESKFDGFWALSLSFTLPSNATNVALSFSNLFADDRGVLELNGTVIGDTPTGPGLMTFTDGGPNSAFVFNGTTSGIITSGFNLGGTNVLTLIVNNTREGSQGTPVNVSPNDYTAAFVQGSVTYGSAPPFPVPDAPKGSGPEGDPSLVNCDSCGQPVTLSNGNMYHQFTDLQLASPGFPIALVRTYNSQAGVGGIFGNGWTHSYQRWLNPSANSVVYYNESGGAFTFTGSGPPYTQPAGITLTLTKTAKGNFQLTTTHGGVTSFDSLGRLSTLADANGNTQTIVYNTQGNIATLSDAFGGTLTFAYDANNHVVSVTDDTGRIVTYQYDSNGNLISSLDPAGALTNYAYSGGFLQTITFADGGVIDYSYDSNKRVAQVTDRGNANNQYTFTPGTQTVLQDELGLNTTFQLNSAGNTTKATAPDGTSTLQTFDANTNLTSRTDQNGAVTTYQYDAQRNLLKRTNTLGGVLLQTFDPVFNKVTSSTDPNGNLTQFQYDSKGNLIKVTDALGDQTAFTYDSSGNILTVTDATGATISAVYDPHSNLTALHDALGNTSQFGYDDLNRPILFADPLGNKFQRQYDALGRITQRTNPLGYVTAFAYDTVGDLVRRTDGAGAVTNFTYDRLHNLTQVVDAAGGTTSYAWSPGNCNCSMAGTLSSIVNAIGQTVSFVYDSNRHVTSSTGPLQAVTQFAYDPAWNPVEATDPNGAALQNAFDKLHRLTQETLPDGTTASFTYDANGNLLTATNPNLTLTYTYDALNRLSSVLDSRFPAATAYTSDKVGRRVSMTDPYGGKTSYAYDANGRLISLTAPDGSSTMFAYDAAGRRTAITLGNGIASAYQYDAASELTSLAYGKLASFTYTYDKVGNKLSMTTPAGANNYQYDALYRLTGATHPVDPAESYVYDPVGNRISATLAAPALTSGAAHYTYDGLGRLSGVTLPNASQVTYKYDPFGRRIEKNVAGVVTRYLYDRDNVLLEQDDSGAAFRARYTYGPRVDEPLVMELSGASYYYLADGAGNIVDLTDSTGAVAASYDFDSFGQLLSSTGTVANPYVFAGRALDQETGLYYFRARYYDPGTGRFVTQDPLSPPALLALARLSSGGARLILGSNLRSPLSLNAYGYVEDNPVNSRDPSGLLGGNIIGGPTEVTPLINALTSAIAPPSAANCAIVAGIFDNTLGGGLGVFAGNPLGDTVNGFINLFGGNRTGANPAGTSNGGSTGSGQNGAPGGGGTNPPGGSGTSTSGEGTSDPLAAITSALGGVN